MRLYLICVIFLAACASPDNYYLLSAKKAPPTVQSAAPQVSIGVGPVLIPDYIDCPEMVFQSGPNKFEIPGSERWAGSLKSAMTKVIATNLSRGLSTSEVRTYPWEPGAKLRYSVAIDVTQFHAQTGGDAVLDATWRIYDEETNRITIQRHSVLTRPLDTDGYEAVVEAESLLLMDLSDAIARAL